MFDWGAEFFSYLGWNHWVRLLNFEGFAVVGRIDWCQVRDGMYRFLRKDDGDHCVKGVILGESRRSGECGELLGPENFTEVLLCMKALTTAIKFRLSKLHSSTPK